MHCFTCKKTLTFSEFQQFSRYIHQRCHIVWCHREDLDGAGAGSYDTTALSASVFQTLFSKILSTYLTRVFTTYMPKISQAHNHRVWKISGSKGLTQHCLCTLILCWNWNLWSCRDSVRQRNFSLKLQIKAVCLAFSITFKWKKTSFCLLPPYCLLVYTLLPPFWGYTSSSFL